MTLQYPEGEAPEEVKPGQFAGIYTGDPSMLLPRPMESWATDMTCPRWQAAKSSFWEGGSEFRLWWVWPRRCMIFPERK